LERGYVDSSKYLFVIFTAMFVVVFRLASLLYCGKNCILHADKKKIQKAVSYILDNAEDELIKALSKN
ncbi:34760_t:CDS:2, partial [Racocetra persica]